MSSTVRTAIGDLSRRKARCVCGRTKPSSADLPNFEFRGPGSRMATQVCVCGYHQLAHHADIRETAVSPTLKNCPGFRPHGEMEYDAFWCGCTPSGHDAA